jgi:hypothetical protein
MTRKEAAMKRLTFMLGTSVGMVLCLLAYQGLGRAKADASSVWKTSDRAEYNYRQAETISYSRFMRQP